MKIAVNTRLLLKNKLDGIGWFTFETLKRITAQHPEHEFLFLFDRKFSDEFIFSRNIKAVVISPQARHPFLYYLWFEYSIPFVLRKEKSDLLLSPDGFLPLSTITNRAGERIRFLPVMHDLNFEAYPKDLPWLTSAYYRYFFPRFARRADRIATVSEYSKNDIAGRYGVPLEKIDVIYNGANEIYCPVSASEQEKTKKEHTAGKPYFLFIGTLHPRKNIANMLRAFDGFKNQTGSDMKLMIVGNKMWWTKDMETALEAMHFKNDVIFAGRLEPSTLARVIASAFCMLYVSTFEGFGIPILESMYCEVPVITSNITSMPEVAGDAALLVNPFSVEAIRDAMSTLYSDKKLYDRLLENGKKQKLKYSWQKTADNLWGVIEKAVKGV